ncbi:MAG TPA: DsbA family protein [Nitrososphaeraceae archaeon]|nr:DsbA family protein [Nitrososphaeraceae archaeon]
MMYIPDRLSGCYILLAVLTISLVLSFAHINSIPLGLASHVTALAAPATDTPEERKHEEENSSMQDRFSRVNTELNNQTISKPENIGLVSKLSSQNLIQSGSPILGNSSAPITIIEFGDFQCEFCDRFARETEPKINATYIQTGKVNMIFKNFVTHGPDSVTAAMAAQCANDQGKFWNFYELLYQDQGEENSGWANANNLKNLATQIHGLNTQKFNSCLDSAKYKSLVDRDNALAISSGFQGTPTFIIEKSDGSKAETLLGAYPFPSFKAIIDKKLNE